MGSIDKKVELALDLYSIGAVRFNKINLVSGLVSPIYVDMRLLISYPKILKRVVELYTELLAPLKYDRLAGVAYAAMPIAGAISLKIERPWIFLRKEAVKKSYGLQKSLEGEYKKGETVVMIEDLVVKATSLLKAIPAIEDHNLVVKDVVVLIDYDIGGAKKMKAKGYRVHSFVTLRELVDIMKTHGKIDAAKHQQTMDFLKA
jgi:uridine monophosphate synthetase